MQKGCYLLYCFLLCITKVTSVHKQNEKEMAFACWGGVCYNIVYTAETIKFIGGLPLKLVIFFFNKRRDFFPCIPKHTFATFSDLQ